MKLLGRKNDDGDANSAGQAEPAATEADSTAATGPAKTTAPKGRPTPKRNEGRRRGPVAPAPMTTSEARARRKAMAGPKLSRAERRAARAERRTIVAERREKMMAGEDAYLLDRDRGPIRKYVRDVVDSRRNVLGLFMPSVLALLFVMIAVPQLQYYVSPALLLLMAVYIIDAIWLSRRINNMVDVKFPDNTESRWRLGFYAASRASQLRRMRAPRPAVNRGDKIS